MVEEIRKRWPILQGIGPSARGDVAGKIAEQHLKPK